MIKFRVDGEPQPTPKKELNRKTATLYPKDYRTKKDKITGKIIKYDHGYKEKWFQQVKLLAQMFMRKHNIKIIKKGSGGIMFSAFTYITKPKSSKFDDPETKPDNDNYIYRTKNILEGICYENDSQITGEFITKDWATEKHQPGVEILIRLNK